MGLVSYQEDNQDAAGEPVKVQKARKTEDSSTDIFTVKNTVIIKADGLAINSIEIESYAFDITFMDGEEQLEPQIDLTATAIGGGVIQIVTFYDIKKACSLLTDLMSAIENQEDVFKVSDRKH